MRNPIVTDNCDVKVTPCPYCHKSNNVVVYDEKESLKDIRTSISSYYKRQLELICLSCGNNYFHKT